MDLKNKKIQKFITLALIILVLTPAVLLSRPKKAEAFWFSTWVTDIQSGIGAAFAGSNLGINTVTATNSQISLLQKITTEVTKVIVGKLLQEMTKSTINWINSGFHGSPLFLENPGSFFVDIGKYEIRNFIEATGYNPVLYPFGRQFDLNLIQSYNNQSQYNAEYSLGRYINDAAYLNNFRNNFSVGGWNGFLINTQYPQNDYIGYQITASEQLAQKLAGTVQNNVQKVQDAVQQGNGFLSPQKCDTNPKYNNLSNQFNQPSFDASAYIKANPEPTPPSCGQPGCTPFYDYAYYQAEAAWNAKLTAAKAAFYDPNGSNGANVCPPRANGSSGLSSTTPGSVVASQIFQAMHIPLQQGSLNAALGNSLSAIFDSLINHFIDKGLNALASTINPAPTPDNFTYFGQTLGTVTPYNSTAWDSGPDEEIVLSKFKQDVKDGITNTALELSLMNNIGQTLSQTWPAIRNLDICQPGPDYNWEKRLQDEQNRNAKELQGKMTDENGDTASKAEQVFGDLTFAVNYFGDWINTEMMSVLPDSIVYLDAIKGIDTLGQQSKELVDNQRSKTQALLRLQAIDRALASFTVQPVAGSPEEKNLIIIRKQYDAVKDSVSSTATVESTRNELNQSEEKLANTVKLVTQCTTERTAAGWANPGGRDSMFTPPTTGPSGSVPPVIPVFEATKHWGGNLTFDSKNNTWLVVSGNTSNSGIEGRIMDNSGKPLTAIFRIDEAPAGVFTGGPRAAYSPDGDKFLVIWNQGSVRGRFVTPDGKTSGNSFEVSPNLGGSTEFGSNVLEYDSSGKKFVGSWKNGPRLVLRTIASDGTMGSLVKIPQTGTFIGAPELAINTKNGEECLAYYSENSGNQIMVRAVSSTGQVGGETLAFDKAKAPSIAYNSADNVYFVTWGDFTNGGFGKAINSCKGSDLATGFTQSGAQISPPSVGAPNVTYNPNSNTYGSITVDSLTVKNYFIIFDPSGNKLGDGYVFTDGANGNYNPAIAADANDGTFGATSAQDYAITRFLPGINPGLCPPGTPGCSFSGSGGSAPPFTTAGTEQALFCDLPIKGGYTHNSFKYIDSNDTPQLSPPPYPTIPLVNAFDIINFGGFFFNLFSSPVDIQLSCNIIFPTDVLTYKGNIPGITSVVQPPPLPYEGGLGGGECSPPPTAAQKQEAQNAVNFMIPLLPTTPIQDPPYPASYQAAVQAVIDQAKSKFPSVGALYYPSENVIGMTFNYIVGPALTVVVSNQIPPGNTWRNAWRVTCSGSGGSVPPPADAATKHGNHTAEVAAAQAQLKASGTDLSGDCGAFTVVKAAAKLIGSGAGVLSKPTGAGCNGYAKDIIAFPDGYIYDVLIGSGANGGYGQPTWTPDGCGTDGTCADRYRTVP